MTLADSLARAFNARDMDSMLELLNQGATAEVLGSPFGVEDGRDDIAKKSFPYLLDSEAGPLTAEAHGDSIVFLRRPDGNQPIDVIVKVTGEGGLVDRIEYLVAGFRRGEMLEIAEPLGIEVCAAG